MIRWKEGEKREAKSKVGFYAIKCQGDKMFVWLLLKMIIVLGYTHILSAPYVELVLFGGIIHCVFLLSCYFLSLLLLSHKIAIYLLYL